MNQSKASTEAKRAYELAQRIAAMTVESKLPIVTQFGVLEVAKQLIVFALTPRSANEFGPRYRGAARRRERKP